MKTLIVGASSGIARSVALLLAQRGEDVILAGRDLDELRRTAADLEIRFDRGAEVVHFEAGGTVDPDVLDACDRLILAVGFLGSETRAVGDADHAQEITFANYEGLLPLLDAAAAAFQRRGHGLIAALSSVAGDRVRRSNRTYGAAKAGLNRHVRQLAVAHRAVHFTIVKLGPVDTEMTYGLPIKMPVSAMDAARGIVEAIDRRAEVAYVPRQWRPIMAIIRRLPQAIADKLA